MNSRSLGRLLNVPFIASLIVFALVIPTTAMWYQSLRVDVTVSLGDSSWGITSYKGMKTIQYGHCGCNFTACKGLDDDEMILSNNKHSLTVQINTTQEGACGSCGCSGHTHHNGNVTGLWVGLVIKNEGSIPLKMSYVSVEVISSDEPENWEMTTYVYPQFHDGVGNKPFWGAVNCSIMPYPGYTSLPTPLNQDYKTVAWIHIEFNGSGTYEFKVTPVLESFNT